MPSCLRPRTLQEIDELCSEWKPEPLEGDALPPARRQLQAPIVTSGVGPYITADGRRVLNMASTNFLGIAGDAGIKVGCWRRLLPHTSRSCRAGCQAADMLLSCLTLLPP